MCMTRAVGKNKQGTGELPQKPTQPARGSPVLHKSVVGALRALITLLDSEPPIAPVEGTEKRWVKRRTSGLEGRAWDRAVAELRPTGVVVRPGRENMIERSAFEDCVAEQRVGTGELTGESGEYDEFVERARKRRRQKKDVDT